MDNEIELATIKAQLLKQIESGVGDVIENNLIWCAHLYPGQTGVQNASFEADVYRTLSALFADRAESIEAVIKAETT